MGRREQSILTSDRLGQHDLAELLVLEVLGDYECLRESDPHALVALQLRRCRLRQIDIDDRWHSCGTALDERARGSGRQLGLSVEFADVAGDANEIANVEADI